LFLAVGAFNLAVDRVQPALRHGISAYSLMVLFGLAGIAFSSWYALFRRPLLDITVWIFENGLSLRRGGEIEACAWEEIQDFKADLNSGHATFWITAPGFCRLILCTKQAPAIIPLAEYIQLKIASAQLLEKVHRIFDG
jgi:hypothetical protein